MVGIVTLLKRSVLPLTPKSNFVTFKTNISHTKHGNLLDSQFFIDGGEFVTHNFF